MKLARGLSLFVAVALVGTFGTACGKKGESAPTSETNPPSTNNNTQQTALYGPQVPTNTAKSAQSTSGKKGATATAPTKAATASGGTASPAGNGGTASSGDNAGASSGGSSSGGNATGGNGGGTTASPSDQFSLAVTQNFGTSNVFDQMVDFSNGQSMLDVMQTHLSIETAYGGGFINSINGIKSGYTNKNIFTRQKRDWFYYVNGSIGSVGVNAYQDRSGDDVWWDYHDWTGDGSNTSSVVGEYPHPFTKGYNGAQPGTIIYYAGNHASEADRLAHALTAQGAGNVRTAAYSDSGVANPSTNVIVVGTWSDLEDESTVQNLFANPTRTGLYAAFDGGKVTGLNYKAKVTDTTGQAAILATGTAGGATTPTWLVIGVNNAGLDQAVDTMVNNPSELHNKIGVVVSGGEAVEVPVAQ